MDYLVSEFLWLALNSGDSDVKLSHGYGYRLQRYNNNNIRLLKIDKPQLNTEMLKVTYVVQT